jgi:25S rRNA (uracil2634-N3)-methyltransferase
MGMRVLTCGDGDFTFSLALARMLLGNEGTSAASKLTATSYETSETLEKVYPNFVDTLTELKQLGCLLQFGFDATRLKESLGITNGDVKFDRIVWNFPCLAVAKGQDGQNGEMDENKALVSKFIVPARDLLTDGGEIHICHKTKPPFNQWRLEEVVTGTCDDVHFQGKVVFDRATTPPYTPRKALDRKSFPCHDACTFIFSLRSRPKGRFHPTLYLGNELMEAVTHELISEIRSAHLVKAQYSSYIEEETKKRSGKKSRKQN